MTVKNGVVPCDELQIEFSAGQPPNHRRVAMIEERTGFLIKHLNSLQVFRIELEVEDVEVLLHSFLSH